MEFKNRYIPAFVKDNLKWYERDGLITYINQLEYKRFEENRDSYLEKIYITNFDIIHSKCRNEPLENEIRYYKTINAKDLKQMPLSDKDAVLVACFRSKRKDIYVEKSLRDKYFKTWYNNSSSRSNSGSSSSSKNNFYKDEEALKKKNRKYFESW